MKWQRTVSFLLSWQLLVACISDGSVEAPELPAFANDTPAVPLPTATASDILISVPSEQAPSNPTAAAGLPDQEAYRALATQEDILALTPARDLNDIALRLKLPPGQTIPQFVHAEPQDRPVGSQDTFFIADANNKNYFAFAATLRYKTAHTYLWVQNDLPFDLNKLRQSADQFEREIYPTDRSVFGEERSPGIDNDVHISIVNGKIPGVGGYFSPDDEYPKTLNPYSNERQAIYMNVDASQPGSANYAATLAHELQHMIEFNVRPHTDAWFNEGASVFAQRVNKLPVGSFQQTFFRTPDTQLNAWEPEAADSIPHYGASYLWLAYFTARFGGPDIMKSLLASKTTDLGAFEALLQQQKTGLHVEDVVADWAVANYVNDPKLAGTRYGYADIKDHAVETGLIERLVPYHGTVHPYATRYLVALQPGGATLHFKGDATTHLMRQSLPAGVSAEWWSNRADQSDTRLTRAVDLGAVTSAHLNYSIWYDIENTFDYGFVEVSTDGQSWKTVPATHTTADNPNGANLGVGYTGVSNPAGRSASAGGPKADPQWMQEQVDLTPYAGQKIQIRFEYVTDAGYSGPGIGLTDIAIPELQWKDDPSRASDWLAEGWLATDNVLQQRFTVQAILLGGQTRVVPVQLNTEQEGSFTIPDAEGVTKVVVVVNAFAAKTTEPASFSITIEPRGQG